MALEMMSGLPVQSKLKSTPPLVISLMTSSMGFSTAVVSKMSVSPNSLPDRFRLPFFCFQTLRNKVEELQVGSGKNVECTFFELALKSIYSDDSRCPCYLRSFNHLWPKTSENSVPVSTSFLIFPRNIIGYKTKISGSFTQHHQENLVVVHGYCMIIVIPKETSP